MGAIPYFSNKCARENTPNTLCTFVALVFKLAQKQIYFQARPWEGFDCRHFISRGGVKDGRTRTMATFGRTEQASPGYG
jgi:hypothetical protein